MKIEIIDVFMFGLLAIIGYAIYETYKENDKNE